MKTYELANASAESQTDGINYTAYYRAWMDDPIHVKETDDGTELFGMEKHRLTIVDDADGINSVINDYMCEWAILTALNAVDLKLAINMSVELGVYDKYFVSEGEGDDVRLVGFLELRTRAA